MGVRSELDRAWREICSRMHSGEHILSRALESAQEGLHVTKVAVDDPVTHIYLTYPGELSWEALFAAETAANRIVAEDRPVEAETLDPEAARELPELKANWDRLPDEPIRVVRIRDYDCIACCGTHVSRTGEVGGIHVLGWRGTAPGYEIDFTVRRDEALERESRLLRRLLRTIGCRPEELEKVFVSLQEDRKSLSKALEKARDLIRLPFEEVPGESPIRVAVATGLPSDLASPAAKRAVEETPGSVVLVLLPSGADDSAAFLLCRGAEVSLDLRAFLKGHPELAARGGGSPEWVSGRTGRVAPSAWIEALRASEMNGGKS
jgi:alanyl-tRNA synthetase